MTAVAHPTPLRVAGRTFEWGSRTYVMGVLNASPDSFSGDGLDGDADLAVRWANRFFEEGADIVEVGGQSYRPRGVAVPIDEELRRVVPMVERLVREVDGPISVDTYSAEVARHVLAAGAHLIDDVGGLRVDPEMAAVVAGAGVPVFLVHQRRPAGLDPSILVQAGQPGEPYGCFLADVLAELRESLRLALAAGIREESIILDPGVAFGKTHDQNLELMDRLDVFRLLGRPLLVGPSRKQFIGTVLDLPPDDRMEGTAAAVAIAIDRGADIVRVHDVREMTRVARVTDAIVRRRRA